MVIEMYESAMLLDGALRVFVVPAALVPLGMLLLAVLLLTNLVWRAQRELDLRAAAAADLQSRIETLISSRAIEAARQVDGEGMKGKAMDVTLYYADIRDFTSFAESRPPTEVVAMLNNLLTIQVDAIHAAGGDVDKIIGDATLAVFYGPERATQAIACAQQVLTRIAGDASLPRRLGIGIHDGFVIAGAVGAPNRQDFTVIGDAVNVSSRLCSLAGEGELVTDTRTLARAGQPDGFGEAAEVKVKGRTEPLRIRRWKAVDATQVSVKE
jgi:class 3 adenylate cyclase